MNELMRISGVTGGYFKNTVVKDVSLTVEKGDFIGLIGPNGSGKTTLLRLVSRVLIPQAGTVMLEGENIFQKDLKSFCRRLAFVSQDITVHFSMSVFEFVMMGRIPHMKRLQFESKRDRAIANEALVLTDTLNLKKTMIDELSSGERQRVFVAKALAQEPSLLLLDEPTSHLDIGHQIQILDLLKKLNRDTGLTTLMVLHDLNLAAEYCNRIVLMDKGSIFKEGVPDDVLTYQHVEAVYQTVVVVQKNPITKKPYVILVPGVQ